MQSASGMKYSVGIIIISDRAASGERPDGCLVEFESAFAGSDFEIARSVITSDNPESISAALKQFITEKHQLVLTCGGTGCGPRDNTPKVTERLIEKFTPGVDQAIRTFSQQKIKFAMYSRGVSGLAEQSFIVNLPGSPKAVSEIVPFLLQTIKHPLDLIARQITDCAEEFREND